jgi:hypothetical protein
MRCKAPLLAVSNFCQGSEFLIARCTPKLAQRVCIQSRFHVRSQPQRMATEPGFDWYGLKAVLRAARQIYQKAGAKFLLQTVAVSARYAAPRQEMPI